MIAIENSKTIKPARQPACGYQISIYIQRIEVKSFNHGHQTNSSIILRARPGVAACIKIKWMRKERCLQQFRCGRGLQSWESGGVQISGRSRVTSGGDIIILLSFIALRLRLLVARAHGHAVTPTILRIVLLAIIIIRY